MFFFLQRSGIWPGQLMQTLIIIFQDPVKGRLFILELEDSQEIFSLQLNLKRLPNFEFN